MITQILMLTASLVTTIHSLEYPAGLDPSICPNYPFCGDLPPVLHNYRRNYPADLDPSSCPNYPYCHQDIFRRVPLPASAYPTGVDPSFCPNYPFCGEFPPVPVFQNYLRRYPADLDPSSCPNYPFCHQDVFRKVLPVYQVPPIILPASAYPTGVDPSICPNYPFCGDPPRV